MKLIITVAAALVCYVLGLPPIALANFCSTGKFFVTGVAAQFNLLKFK